MFPPCFWGFGMADNINCCIIIWCIWAFCIIIISIMSEISRSTALQWWPLTLNNPSHDWKEAIADSGQWPLSIAGVSKGTNPLMVYNNLHSSGGYVARGYPYPARLLGHHLINHHRLHHELPHLGILEHHVFVHVWNADRWVALLVFKGDAHHLKRVSNRQLLNHNHVKG